MNQDDVRNRIFPHADYDYINNDLILENLQLLSPDDRERRIELVRTWIRRSEGLDDFYQWVRLGPYLAMLWI